MRATAFKTTAALIGWLVLALAGPLRAAEIQRVVSPGGVEAWLVEERAIPIVSFRIGFRGGANLESEDKAGLAKLFAGMLEEGAGPYDATAFSDKADEIAARYSFSAGQDQITIGAAMLVERREESLELLRLALTEPRFDPEPLARVKAQMLSRIRQREVDPNAIARRRWYSGMFPNDPYGRSNLGTAETVQGLTAEDLHQARPMMLNRSGMKIGVVGAISAEELGPALDKLLGDLPMAKRAPLEPAEPSATGGVEVVPFEAPQSAVIFGHEGPKRDDPDFIAAYVMNYVLGGGGFVSRLTEEVREKRGLAYGVYSYLSPFDRAGLYVGGVATANERVAETVDLVKSEWRRMAEQGVTPEELEKAKTYLTGAYPLRFDSNGEIANFLVGAQMEDLGIDYIHKRNDLVEAVTLEDIARVAKKWLKPEKLRFVVVGEPVGLTTDSN